MTRPTARVLHLLDLLQSTGSRSLAELAARLEVDERTVRRYVEHLRDLGVPVESRRGRHGGYRVAPGYRMPPLMLTDDEALATLAGLAAVRADPAAAGSAAVETALAKIRRALPRGLAERSAALLEAPVTAPARAAVVDSEVLLTVADAVRHRRPLAMRYRSRDGVSGNRTLHPVDLIAHEGRWYVAGWDVVRHGARTFRLDRILSARPLPGTFPAPPSRDAVDDLLAGFARADYTHVVRLRVAASREELDARLPRAVAVVGDAEDLDGVVWHGVEIHAERLDWLPALLLGLDAPIVIEEPEALRHLLDRAGRRLLAAAAGRPAWSAPVAASE